jgi:hypothetical protein
MDRSAHYGPLSCTEQKAIAGWVRTSSKPSTNMKRKPARRQRHLLDKRGAGDGLTGGAAQGRRARQHCRWPPPSNGNSGSPPENVCSRLLSLLQCLPSQTFSVDFRAAKKARFRAVLRVGLGVRQPERYGKCLSERRSLSEAWGLADLLYKLLCQLYQPINLIEGPSRDLGDHAALAKARSALAIRSNR